MLKETSSPPNLPTASSEAFEFFPEKKSFQIKEIK
jgi:hypothetical protein